MEGTERIRLYKELDGTVYEVEKPLTCFRDVKEIAEDLNIPPHVDLALSPMETAVVIIWYAVNCPASLNTLAERKKIDTPLTPLLFGGAAVKMLSPSANEPGSPLNRQLRDLDYVVTKREGPKFLDMLTLLSSFAGTRYHHFLTSSDRRFNAIRAGTRYRIRSVQWSTEFDTLLGWVDILVEKIPMRHEIDVRDEFERMRSNWYTIGFEKMIVSKCQSISEINEERLRAVENSSQTFRVLNYKHYRAGRSIIGMEEKDALDVCALLHDSASKEGSIDAARLNRALSKDQRLLLTVRLNLENIVARADWLRSRGLSEGQIAKIGEAAGSILRALPSVDKKWSKPWWNTEVDTPAVA